MGCFTRHGVGVLHRITEIMDQYVYKQILVYFNSSHEDRFPDGDFVIQEDNDPKHTARSVKSYFEYKGWKVLDCLAQSPDLNPIEKL
jgi:hypothetical protein